MDQYYLLEKLLLSREELHILNFPRSTHTKGKAILMNREDIYFPGHLSKHIRRCNRCKRKYIVTEKGKPVVNEKCYFHDGKKPRSGELYPCCGGKIKSPPCTERLQHMHEEVDADNLVGFISTTEGRLNKSIVAIDCEMVYTDCGNVVAAMSMVNENYETIMEKVIIPEGIVLDYNTFHTSLTENNFIGIKDDLKDLQKEILKHVGDNTILVGHGLHNDLLKLKIIHDKIFDTTIAYPHPRGLPLLYRLDDLRNLYLPVRNSYPMHCKLKCTIDAVDAMKLAMLKIRI